LEVFPAEGDISAVLSLSGSDMGGNSASAEIPCAWDGPRRKIVVHHRHLMELIGAAGAEQVELLVMPDTHSRKSPILVREASQVLIAQQMLLDWNPT